ncbi:MAG: sialate O-acetylesterase [Bacteroidia bacterium]|nr:sialate O-acetylesterase [Bacteroidia bacterium]
MKFGLWDHNNGINKKITFALSLLLSASYSLAQKPWDTIPNLPLHYTQRIEAFRKEPIATGKIMFLGNSITEGADFQKLLKDSTVINRGISGDITFGILNRVDDVIKRKPAKLFVMIGINDLFKEIPDEVVLQNVITFVRIVKSGSPKTELILQSILPVNKSFKNFPKNYDKEDHITTINAQLKKLSKHFGYTYIDLYNQFTNTNDQLEEKYSYDGLHLNAVGYTFWVEILKREKYL